jgi:amino acid adenylation domain-containing protein
MADPELRLSEFQILSAEEREQIVVEWNETGTEYLRGKTIHELFEEQASETPDDRAIVFEGEQLTYGELNEKANQLAHYLRKLGVGPEVMVGICVERSLEMVIGLLGILKAGGAYVPLDLAYPSERVSFILEDARAPVLLTQERLLENLPAHAGQTVCLDKDWERISGESRENPKGEAGASNLAYIIYTSGSTGRPKGVAIEHRSTVALVEWTRTVFREEELKGVLASTSICFDLSVFELFVTLSRGGTIIMAEDALQLLELEAANEVTLINTVPSAVAELVRVGGIPGTVRTVNLAGEPLAQTLVEQIYEQESIERVIDLYGPSEDTTYSTYALRRRKGQATIGRPIANTQVYILDKEMQPVPIGIAGELHLGGEGLARGYLNRAELTREKFISNPFSSDPEARVYRTGDLARYLPDGNIEFLGRIDHQVKVRGYRIELGEIETALEAYPGIEKSVVMAREDQPGNKRLVAYVVPRVEETVGISELRSYLMQHLPEYMVPAFFVVLEKLPLTTNGKIDRRALPVPDATRPALQGPSVAPRDSTEFQLVSIWEKLLNIQPIGATDNFFELGGDSLLAVRLFAQIKEVFGESLHLATLFRAPTIEQLARIIDQEGGSEGWPSLVAIQPSGSLPPLYCAHACGGNVLIYRTLARFLNRLMPDQPIYGLQAQGLDGKGTPLSRIEDMAAHYIKEVRAHQPEGPYYLLGDTWGGLIVFEMAQQLHRQGQRVALVAMLDTICLLPPTRIRRVRDHVELLLQSGLKRYAQAAVKGTRTRLMGRVQENGNHSVASAVANSESSSVDPLKRTMDAIDQAHLAYVPPRQSYPGKITYFYAKDNRYLNPSDDNRMEWKRVVKGLDVHVIPGRHDTIREEPHVQFFAEELATCLQNAQINNSVATARETIPSGYHSRLERAERMS